MKINKDNVASWKLDFDNIHKDITLWIRFKNDFFSNGTKDRKVIEQFTKDVGLHKQYLQELKILNETRLPAVGG